MTDRKQSRSRSLGRDSDQTRERIDQIIDQVASYRRDHYTATDDLAIFAGPDAVTDLKRKASALTTTTETNVTVSGLPVKTDYGVSGVRVLPERLTDLDPDQWFFETPPDHYLDQLLDIYTPQQVFEDDPSLRTEYTVSARVPFELRGERVEIDDRVQENWERYSAVPAETDERYQPGERLYLAQLALSGGAARTRKSCIDALRESIRDVIGDTITKPVHGSKHYTIRSTTGVETHRTEPVTVGTREYELGRVFCTPYDIRDDAERVINADVRQWELDNY